LSELKYSVITSIKESNKGKVYLAQLEGYDFPVIVKELKHGNKAVFQTLSELNSVYVPQIYKIEESVDGLVVAEEYIEGETLSTYLASGTFTETEWLYIAKQLCEALHSLHTQEPPIIHRDIKPSNIVIDSKGRVKLIDFDSSRLYKEESEGDTRLLGTERYAPPEQYGFSQTDCRSDIYSLGVVFGMFPVFASKARQKRWKQIVEKCTLFAPESRFQSAEAVWKEVNRIIKTKRSSGKIYGVGIGILLLLVVTLMLWWPKDSVPSITEDVKLPPTSVPVTKPVDPPLTSMPVTKPADPTPTSVPVTKPADPPPTSMPVTEEVDWTTPPEWRDIEDEIPEYVALKERIRNDKIMMSYCFKDRLWESGFWLQSAWLGQKQIKLLRLRLHSYRDNTQVVIKDEYYEIYGSIIRFDNAYMRALDNGYYMVEVCMYNVENGQELCHGIEVYVAESDAWENDGWWLQNSTFSFDEGKDEILQLVVMNDSSNEIVSVRFFDGTPVEPSLYRILHEGKVLEFSNEFLRKYVSQESVELFVIGKEGRDVPIRIDNYRQDNLQ